MTENEYFYLVKEALTLSGLVVYYVFFNTQIEMVNPFRASIKSAVNDRK